MANKVYTAPETTITFRDSAGDVVMTLQNLATGAGRVSARYDRGAGSKPKLHEVTVVIQQESNGTAGEVIEVYLFQSDGTYMDGTLGASDAALTTDKRRNGMLIGVVVIDNTTNSVDVVARFTDVPITSRYYSLGVWNATAVSLKNTANTSRIIVTPIPDEVQ